MIVGDTGAKQTIDKTSLLNMKHRLSNKGNNCLHTAYVLIEDKPGIVKLAILCV
jgi:hypothetical protein